MTDKIVFDPDCPDCHGAGRAWAKKGDEADHDVCECGRVEKPTADETTKVSPAMLKFRRRPRARVDKYDYCPCGSGKKVKWCGCKVSSEMLREG